MVRGQGMPTYRHHDFGNLYIKFNVKFPEKNWTEDPTAFDALRRLLPAPAVENVPPTNAMTEAADLEEVDQQAGGAGGSRGFAGVANPNAMSDDDEDGNPQAERVQCASQ